MTNIVDPDQTAPEEQSEQDLHCLLRHYRPNFMAVTIKITGIIQAQQENCVVCLPKW